MKYVFNPFTGNFDAINDSSAGESFDGNRTITRSGLPNINVGGTTTAEFLENLCFPAVPPTLSFSSLGGPYEKGLARSLSLSATVTPNDAASIDLRQFKQGATVISTEASNAMSESVSSIKTTVTYTAYVEYMLDGAQTLSANQTASFYAPSFYGVGAAGNENETWVKANLTKTIRANRILTATFNPTLQRYYFVYPQSMGALSSVLDPNNFEVISGFTQFTATFTLADGSSEPYYIYRSNDNTTQSGYQLRFN